MALFSLGLIQAWLLDFRSKHNTYNSPKLSYVPFVCVCMFLCVWSGQKNPIFLHIWHIKMKPKGEQYFMSSYGTHCMTSLIHTDYQWLTMLQRNTNASIGAFRFSRNQMWIGAHHVIVLRKGSAKAIVKNDCNKTVITHTQKTVFHFIKEYATPNIE